MAKISNISSYPVKTDINAKDYLIGTDGVATSPSLQTKVFTLADIAEFVQNQTTVDTSNPFLITASAGGSSSYSSSKNTIYATWTGNNGTYELTLPSATSTPYRIIRLITDGTLNASDKIYVLGPGTETVNDASFYNVNKAYNGAQFWSDGSNWIVIQAVS
jgi:hypothetical protein